MAHNTHNQSDASFWDSCRRDSAAIADQVKKRCHRTISYTHSDTAAQKKLYDFTFVIKDKDKDKEILVRFNRTDNLYLRAEKYITKYGLSDTFGDTRTRNQIVDHMEKILADDRSKNPDLPTTPVNLTPNFTPSPYLNPESTSPPTQTNEEENQKKMEELTKMKQQNELEEKKKKDELQKVRDRIKKDKEVKKTEAPSSSLQHQVRTPTASTRLPPNTRTLQSINPTRQPDPPASPEDDLFKLLAKLHDSSQKHHQQPAEHDFGEGGRVLSQTRLQHSPSMQYGSLELKADLTQPKVNIKICLLNNQRITLVCNPTHTVADLYQHVNFYLNSLTPQPQSYILKMSHPLVVFLDGSVTVEKAQLKNALIHQAHADGF